MAIFLLKNSQKKKGLENEHYQMGFQEAEQNHTACPRSTTR